ncbi:MAG TPA: hypothetical protein VKK31_14060 [Thermoanaerobaculia bacterium]|nr:hypothetical protein [Thermoanaerobaculia bacterium]
MNQLPAYNSSRNANQSLGIVERFQQKITRQEENILPEAFHREAEILEASVALYGTILDGVPSAETQRLKIRERMSQDSAIAPYLSAADGNPQHAVKMARADVEYWRCLKRAGWKTKEQRKRAMSWRLAKLVILPLVIVLATALLGNLVASSIQDRAFQKQKFFDAKFQRLKEGQQRSVALVARLRSVKDVMAGWERFGGGVSPRQMLGGYREEIEQIRALGLDSEGGGQVSSVALKAQQQLDSYISCLDGKVGQQRRDLSASSCSEGFDLKIFETLTLSFVKEIDALAT